MDLNNRHIHYTKADFYKQIAGNIIHLVQYDNTIPVIAINLYMNGYVYEVPSEAIVRIRWNKPDGTYSLKYADGFNDDRTVVYFEVDENMSAVYGSLNPVLEITTGSTTVVDPETQKETTTVNIACSSYIYVDIAKNPVQNSDQKSQVDDELIQEIRVLVDTVDYEIDNGSSEPSDKLIEGGIFYENLNKEE